MEFLLTWTVFETVTQEQAKPLQADLAQGLPQMIESPKIQYVVSFTDARGGYMVLDGVYSADEILENLGPEILDNSYVDSHPITSAERAGELFGQWVQ